MNIWNRLKDLVKPRTSCKAKNMAETIDPNNGLILNGVYIPEEVLVLILSNLDSKTIVKLRQVCKRWNEIASGDAVWHEKAIKTIPGLHQSFFRHHKLSWLDFFWMCHKAPFRRNLIKNPCGGERYLHWKITEGGDGWEVEKDPVGCEPFPKPFSSCFASSYEMCSAEQTINLHTEGLTQTVLDMVNPIISFSDWYAGRWDCGIYYQLAVSLLDSEKKVLKTYKFTDKLEGNDRNQWRNVKGEFREYGKGVHYVCFDHCGKDTQFWSGNYGAKVTGAEVTISIPDAHR